MKKNLVALIFSLGLVILASQVILADESKLPFSDVKTTNWYYSNLVDLYTKGIINGFEDGTFKGSQSLKKDQMLKLVITTIAPGANYTRNSDDTWFAPYLRICRDLEIEDMPETIETKDANGNVRLSYEEEDISKKYNVDISREDIAVYTYKALMYGVVSAQFNYLTQYTDDEIKEILKEQYKDYESINEENRYAIAVLLNEGIMQGDDSKKFNPKQNLNRAEATAIIYRLRQKREEYQKYNELDSEKINEEVSEAGEGTENGTKVVSMTSPFETKKYTQEEIDELFNSTDKLIEEFGEEVKDLSEEEIFNLYKYYCEEYLAE